MLILAKAAPLIDILERENGDPGDDSEEYIALVSENLLGIRTGFQAICGFEEECTHDPKRESLRGYLADISEMVSGDGRTFGPKRPY